MTMSSLVTSTLLATLLLIASLCHPLPLSPPKGTTLDSKLRLGSTPPSCHNRCNGCIPCIPVQVPTLPRRSPAFSLLRASYIMYSNYKPLGWKCQCGDQFFNP